MYSEQTGFDAESSFWANARAVAARAGREVLEKVLWLYYAAQKPEVPAKAKTVIWGALAYFIVPLDAIPDVVGPVGYTDDLAILTTALAVVATHIDAGVRAQASAKLRDWFDALG